MPSIIYTMTQKVDLYPNCYEMNDDNSGYRLKEISKLRSKLTREKDERAKLYKGYKRFINTIAGIGTTSNGISLTAAGISVVLVSTGLGIVIAVPLATASGVLTCIGIACNFINRKLYTKLKKHDNIKMAAESKLNSILEIVNTAINDGKITQDEFKIVVDEVQRYYELKDTIKGKTLKVVLEEEKEFLIDKGRQEILKKIQQVGN